MSDPSAVPARTPSLAGVPLGTVCKGCGSIVGEMCNGDCPVPARTSEPSEEAVNASTKAWFWIGDDVVRWEAAKIILRAAYAVDFPARGELATREDLAQFFAEVTYDGQHNERLANALLLKYVVTRRASPEE